MVDNQLWWSILEGLQDYNRYKFTDKQYCVNNSDMKVYINNGDPYHKFIGPEWKDHEDWAY